MTRSIHIPELPPELRNALLTHANKKKLGLVAATAWLTHRENAVSTKLLGRLLRRRSNHADPDTWCEMACVLHPTHILFVARGDANPTHVDIFSVPLASATFTRRAMSAGTPSDDGFDIGGFVAAQGAPEHFMALGTGPAAEACLSATKAAIDGARAA